MKKFFNYLILFLVVISLQTFAQNNKGESNNITGTWLGKLKFSGIELRVVFNIKRNDDEILTATMQSPDQTPKLIPVDTVIYNNGNIKLEVKAVHGYFEGAFNADSLTFTGRWNQFGNFLPLVLKKVDKVEVFKRPQEPKPPFPYKAEDVSFENKSAGITLSGTLTMPKTGKPFPAVLLITGSGKQNRDEEIFNHKPFLVIADYLTRRGIAVLRVDDRGAGKSTGDFSTATSQDFAGDALAGVEFLKSNKSINPKEIGLIGHSEGGMIAPMVAVKSSDVAFIVLLAGPGLSGDQILLKQTATIDKLEGAPDSIIEKDTSFKSKLLNVIKKDTGQKQIDYNFEIIVTDYYNTLSEREKTEAGSSDNLLRTLMIYTTPWWKFFIRYNPVPTLEKVKCPVLALDGSKDVQVPPEEDLAAIKSALEKGGNKNFEIHEIPGLNHLFQDAKTGAPSEYSQIEETFSPKALKLIGDWILKITVTTK